MSIAPDVALSAAAGQAEAQYRLGAGYFGAGDIQSALEWLTRAADQHWPDAQNLLGVIYANGIGVTCQPSRAAQLFAAATRRDLKEAHFNLSGLLFSGSVAQADDAAAMHHLLHAAELGHRAAWRVLGYLYSLESTTASAALATGCFARAALQGDAYAEYVLGLRFLRGVGVAADVSEAAYWFASATNKQIYCAAERLRSLVDKLGEAQVQRGIRECVPHAKQLADSSREVVAPDIVTTISGKSLPTIGAVSDSPNIIDEQLCDYLINLAASRVRPSGVVDPASGKPLQSNLRTSSSMNFQLSMYDAAVGLVCRRLASLAGSTVTHAEPLSVLRYMPGQEYKPHYDHFAVDEQGAPRVRDGNGQRVATVFVYLNDVQAGGETNFPRLGVRVQPAKGKAVAFQNCDAHGQPNPDMLHAGMPVMHGEKWLATLWFRERPFVWA
ncbi:MAG: 2OG-Fe(II) oxygenase [Gammaproteobacteria bacterium]